VSVCVCSYLSFTGVVTTAQHLTTQYYTLMGGFSRSYWLNHMWFPLLSYILRHRSPPPADAHKKDACSPLKNVARAINSRKWRHAAGMWIRLVRTRELASVFSRSVFNGAICVWDFRRAHLTTTSRDMRGKRIRTKNFLWFQPFAVPHRDASYIDNCTYLTHFFFRNCAPKLISRLK